jgi:hypothetical protein
MQTMTQEHHPGNSSGSDEVFVLVAHYKHGDQPVGVIPSQAEAESFCERMALYHQSRPDPENVGRKLDRLSEATQLWFDHHPARAYDVDVLRCTDFGLRAVPYWSAQE